MPDRRWGISLPLDGMPLHQQAALLREAEDLGYTDAWTAEVDGVDAFSPLAVAALSTRHMRLGTAIVNVYTRGPATIAMSAAGMAEIAPGRFCLGLGSGSKPIVETWNGGRFDRPLQRVRDVAGIVRRALSGERVVTETPSLAVGGFRLSRPVQGEVPIFIAALRQNMLRLAGEIGDGVILNWLSPEDVATCLAEVRAGMRRAGRDPATAPFEVGARLFVWLTDDRAAADQLARRSIAGYLTVPTYRAFHDWLGRQEALAPMQEAWSAGDRKRATEVIPPRLVDDLLIIGTPEQCRERVLQYMDAGITVPFLQLHFPHQLAGAGPGQNPARPPAELNAWAMRALAPGPRHTGVGPR